MGQGKKDEAEALKAQVQTRMRHVLRSLEAKEKELQEKITKDHDGHPKYH